MLYPNFLRRMERMLHSASAILLRTRSLQTLERAPPSSSKSLRCHRSRNRTKSRRHRRSSRPKSESYFLKREKHSDIKSRIMGKRETFLRSLYSHLESRLKNFWKKSFNRWRFQPWNPTSLSSSPYQLGREAAVMRPRQISKLIFLRLADFLRLQTAPGT